MHEADLDKLAGMRLQLEVQVNTLESANINANTLDVMRKGANALKDIRHPQRAVRPPIYIYIEISHPPLFSLFSVSLWCALLALFFFAVT